jgi:hypothetical protein
MLAELVYVQIVKLEFIDADHTCILQTGGLL